MMDSVEWCDWQNYNGLRRTTRFTKLQPTMTHYDGRRLWRTVIATHNNTTHNNGQERRLQRRATPMDGNCDGDYNARGVQGTTSMTYVNCDTQGLQRGTMMDNECDGLQLQQTMTLTDYTCDELQLQLCLMVTTSYDHGWRVCRMTTLANCDEQLLQQQSNMATTMNSHGQQ
jgi:hypothetical protein